MHEHFCSIYISINTEKRLHHFSNIHVSTRRYINMLTQAKHCAHYYSDTSTRKLINTHRFTIIFKHLHRGLFIHTKQGTISPTQLHAVLLVHTKHCIITVTHLHANLLIQTKHCTIIVTHLLKGMFIHIKHGTIILTQLRTRLLMYTIQGMNLL